MRIISLEKEINRFEGTGLNDLCPKESFSFDREQGFRGREGSTYWCMPAVLCSLFSFVISNSFSFSLFFSQCLLLCCDSLVEVIITVIVIPLTVHGKDPLYNTCRDQLLLFQPLTTFVWAKCPCRSPLVCKLPSHHYLPVLAVPFLITRQRRLFCLFVCHDTLTCYGVGALSLFIPHGMNLVVPTHPYFFWAVCYPSKTFPLKEPEYKPQNRFSPLTTARLCPLTSNP